MAKPLKGQRPLWKAETIFALPPTTSGPRNNSTIYQYDSLPNAVDKTRIFTNHFEIVNTPKTLEKYSISFKMSDSLQEGFLKMSVNQTRSSNHREPRVREKRKAMSNLRRNNLQGKVQWESYPWVTNYSNTVWAIKRFPDIQGGMSFRNVTFEQENGRTDTVEITFTWQEQLRFEGAPGSLSPDHIAAVNALASHDVSGSLSVMHVGANKFYVRSGWQDIGSIAAYRGYYTSARASDNRLLLNVNTVTSPFFMPMLVSKLMRDLSAHPEYANNLPSLLKHLRVRIIYNRIMTDPGNDPNTLENRMKVITGLGKPPNEEMSRFGSTVEQHYLILGAPTPDRRLRCVNVGKSDDPQWIPPEFLEIAPEQQFRAPLSATHTAGMVRKGLRGPAANAAFIVQEGVGRNFLGIRPPQAALEKLDLTIGQQMLQLPFKIRDAPMIGYGKKPALLPQDASWNLRKQHFYKVPESMEGNLSVGLLDISGSNVNVEVVKTEMQKQFDSLDMKKVKMDGHLVLPSLAYTRQPPEEYETPLKNGLKGSNRLVGVAALLIIVAAENKTSYAAIKRYMDMDLGLQTVCAVASKIRGARDQFFGNLALKFNIKLGGINHRVLAPSKKVAAGKISLEPKSAFGVIEDSTIVMGADVVHPPTESMKGCPSIAALVANDDRSFTNFPGHMRLNPARQEIIEDLSDMVYEGLGKYYLKNGKLPSNILFYRDGVSENQYEAVTGREVPSIRKGYELAQERVRKLAADPRMQEVEVRIHFVIVQKRHHVRFYASDQSQCAVAKKDGNVKPGLLVDTDVIRPGKPNFYLQPHAALQGTARPTHYVILHAEIPFLTIEEVIDITHAFCYNYARATKGVSYCGPTYYADRLCDRGYVYLRRLYLDHNTRPIPALVQQGTESDTQFYMRMKTHVQTHSYWNVGGKKNPWHRNMDNLMFFL